MSLQQILASTYRYLCKVKCPMKLEVVACNSRTTFFPHCNSFFCWPPHSFYTQTMLSLVACFLASISWLLNGSGVQDGTNHVFMVCPWTWLDAVGCLKTKWILGSGRCWLTRNEWHDCEMIQEMKEIYWSVALFLNNTLLNLKYFQVIRLKSEWSH